MENPVEGPPKPAEEQTSVEQLVQQKEEEWCFGMIVGLQTTVVLTDTALQTHIPLYNPKDSSSLFEISTDKHVADLGRYARRVMDVLQAELSVQIFADCTIRAPIPSTKTGFSKQPCKPQRGDSRLPSEVYVVLYGRPCQFENVGKFAGACNLFLQHPVHCDRNVPYRNPHCLSPRHDETTLTYDLGVTFSSDHYSDTPSNPIDLFTDGEDRARLEEADSPNDLHTTLYKHQKQALTFMLQREEGWSLDGPRKDVWKSDLVAGRLTYINTITGWRRYKPPPSFRGGLLIDAPGLGKSLSIIALVAAGRAQNAGSTTLLVVPKSLIPTWKDELQKHLRSDSTLKHCVYYGKEREKYLERVGDNALIITTYSIVRNDWKATLGQSRDRTLLHNIVWSRIVLDEAHTIREPSKSFAKSICALRADRRWAVTGTPIQNRLMDLFSLFRFLQAFPFDDVKIFNSEVTEKWRTKSDPASVAKLKTLVKYLCLRRPKETVHLPHREDKTTYVDFSNVEWYQYQKIRDGALNQINSAYDGRSGTSYLNALKWVNELRLLCTHGTASSQILRQKPVEQRGWSESEAQTYFDGLEQLGLAKCSNPDCGQELSSALTDDDHCDEPSISEILELYCSPCVERESEGAARLRRVCNHLPRRSTEPVDGFAAKGSLVAEEAFSTADGQSMPTDSSTPSKIKRVLQDLLETPNDVKSVIFSFWTKTFDILQPLLCAKSIRCVRLDGSLSATGRANVLRVFRANPDIKVLLATISCGGIGLDLTVASRAYIMEPQWNPMSESQALDRVHRLGQVKQVMTTRYVMRRSFDEQVLNIQRRKEELADLTLNHSNIRKDELTYGRLQYLKELVG
ncbi:MAG: hypothetical protein Q9195_009075 [Heterodermia aff. obscurata]